MEKISPVLGVMVCMSAISYFLSSCILRWEASNAHNSLRLVFTVLNFILLFCSAPVSILIRLYMKRTENICAEENSKKVSDVYNLMYLKTSELEKELTTYRLLASSEREEGYRRGWKDARAEYERKLTHDLCYEYKRGYLDGQEDYPLGINRVAEFEADCQ